MKFKSAVCELIVVLMILAILASSASLVSATPSTSVEGTFKATPIPSTMIVREAGPNLFIYREANGLWTGGISGTTYGYQNIIVHKEGKMNFHITGFFESATVMGKTGSLNVLLVGNSDPEGTQGTWRIISGTGDLWNLKGQGSWWKVPTDTVFSYSGQVHFDP